MNQYAMYAAAAVLETVVDIIVLTMPMFIIWRLRVSSRDKWIITGIFLLGGL